MFLALSLLLAPLTGCGSESPDEQAGDPTPAETSTGAPSSSENPGEHEVLDLVSQSDVGGEVAPMAAPLDSATTIADFSEQFDDDRMRASISTALVERGVPDGRTVVGAVVAIGCEAPTEVEVLSGPDGVEITAAPVKTDQQCLVPVTTVALVAVDSSLV